MSSFLACALVAAPPAALPGRVERIVLHTPGGPFYGRPEMRFVFLDPPRTRALWRKPRFGAHWIVWTDGSLWPRHPRRGEAGGVRPPIEASADESWRRRLAEEAAPVYAHVRGGNEDSVGIEVAHSGRSEDPFPAPQVQSLAWLLRTLLSLSGGRLTPSAIAGHKDLDRRPAYVSEKCEKPGCPVFVDSEGREYRRRVDPPERLFEALRAEGLDVARAGREGDEQLLRAEAIPRGTRPRVVRR